MATSSTRSSLLASCAVALALICSPAFAGGPGVSIGGPGVDVGSGGPSVPTVGNGGTSVQITGAPSLLPQPQQPTRVRVGQAGSSASIVGVPSLLPQPPQPPSIPVAQAGSSASIVGTPSLIPAYPYPQPPRSPSPGPDASGGSPNPCNVSALGTDPSIGCGSSGGGDGPGGNPGGNVTNLVDQGLGGNNGSGGTGGNGNNNDLGGAGGNTGNIPIDQLGALAPAAGGGMTAAVEDDGVVCMNAYLKNGYDTPEMAAKCEGSLDDNGAV